VTLQSLPEPKLEVKLEREHPMTQLDPRHPDDFDADQADQVRDPEGESADQAPEDTTATPEPSEPE
jgi:hypothetical protein